MAEFASKGVAGAGLGLGIAGTALGLMNGGLGNVLGGLGTRQTAPVATVSTPVADGTAIMAGALGGMMYGGWNHNGWNHGGCCSEDHLVNRYEAGKDSRIAELRKQAAKAPATIDVPMIGPITFGPADVDSLHRHIMQAGGVEQ